MYMWDRVLEAFSSAAIGRALSQWMTGLSHITVLAFGNLGVSEFGHSGIPPPPERLDITPTWRVKTIRRLYCLFRVKAVTYLVEC